MPTRATIRSPVSLVLKHLLVPGVLAGGFFAVAYFGVPSVLPISYQMPGSVSPAVTTPVSDRVPEKKPFVATHIPTPESVKAIYMTACVAGTPAFRSDLVRIVETTELNAIIIDIKDYTGGISFEPESNALKGAWSVGCGARDMREFIRSLHEKGIYVIGRITVFQDPYYTGIRPDLAVKRASDTSIVWKDYKGISFIDVGAEEYWDYIVTLAQESYAAGFDELNFDYIRFPSDGNMRDIYFPWSEDAIASDPHYGKANVVRSFFSNLHGELKNTGAVLSADLFGMVTTNTDDLNIGQVLEFALPYFDYIAPMVYPSHYPKHFNGYANPNHYPYEIINFSMTRAVERLSATTTHVATFGDERIASSTMYTKLAFDPLKLRPWLQDFDYGGTYDEAEVRAQIQAVYDAGLTSWMLWAPSNRYTVSALEPAPPSSTENE